MPRKKDKYTGPDPDPTDFLYVSLESKRLSSEKTYDAKKSCWVPCLKDGFAVGEIRGVKGDQITVFASNKVSTVQLRKTNHVIFRPSQEFLIYICIH